MKQKHRYQHITYLMVSNMKISNLLCGGGGTKISFALLASAQL